MYSFGTQPTGLPPVYDKSEVRSVPLSLLTLLPLGIVSMMVEKISTYWWLIRKELRSQTSHAPDQSLVPWISDFDLKKALEGFVFPLKITRGFSKAVELRHGVLLAFVVPDAHVVKMREGVGFVQLLGVSCLMKLEGTKLIVYKSFEMLSDGKGFP